MYNPQINTTISEVNKHLSHFENRPFVFLGLAQVSTHFLASVRGDGWMTIWYNIQGQIRTRRFQAMPREWNSVIWIDSPMPYQMS